MGRDATTNWLIAFVGLYWAYCLVSAALGARSLRATGADILGRQQMAPWIVVAAVTAVSFSGWAVMHHPALIYQDGFPYAFASLGAIVIPLTGLLFLKRQWIIGKRFFLPTAGLRTQILIARLGIAMIVPMAFLLAVGDYQILQHSISVAAGFGFQLWPALIALCFWPYLSRMGVVLGLIAGLMTVTLAELSGLGWLDTSSLRGWEHWLLAAHPAGLGILVNLAVAISVSAITGDHRLDLERKLAFHGTLREHAALPAERRPFVPMAWMITLIWLFFAIGPGVVIGNWIFGDPAQPASWFFGMPSIWAWQFLFWALGVGMVGFLAYVMQMSTGPETEVEALANDIAELEALLRG